ncbi:MAG: penicillin acylase family protein, partial [Dehalococcoidia bacterium]
MNIPPRAARALSTLDALRGIAQATARTAAKRGFPRVEGRTAVRGLSAEVQVVRDHHGVPHVFAANEADSLFGQGFVHAQDRLFQMAAARRLASGRLAEVAGPSALGSDRFMRRIGLHRAAARDAAGLDDGHRALLAAYCAGVNEGARTLPEPPPEFSVFGPWTPWTPQDAMLIGRLVLFGFAGNWDTELLRERLLRALGPERTAQLDPAHPSSGTVTGATHLGGAVERLARAYRDAVAHGLPHGGASNAWTVDATRSVSRAPLLASDPHLEVRIPGLFHVTHVRGGVLNAAGADIPGVPGIAMGHTAEIAWGITAGMADIADCYVESFDPASPRHYRTPDGWAEAEEVIERIDVRGAAPVDERVLITRHGPVIGPAIEGESRAIALRSTALEAGDLIEAFFAVTHAHSVEEFSAALDRWPGTAFNFVYAHRDGSTGYRLAGRIPQRAEGEGLLPASGERSPGPPPPWPPAAMPRLASPGAGYIVSANQAPGGNLELGEEWCEPVRAQRITALIEAQALHDTGSFQAIQTDRHNANLVRLRDLLLARGAVAQPEGPILERWDGRLDPASAGAAVVQAVYRELARAMALRAAGPSADTVLGHGLSGVSSLGSFHFRVQGELVTAAETAAAPWFDGGADRDRQLAGAAARAVERLRRDLGDDLARWRWGAMHQIEFTHPLRTVPGVGKWLSRGPYPFGGDVNTVVQAAEAVWRQDGRVLVAPGYRQVEHLA